MVSPTLLVGTGGVLGALARHLLGERIETRTVDTLVVNIFGSFLLGLLVAVPVGDSLLSLFGTGFCGAFTTFSTFSFETVRQYETGEKRRAAATAALSLLGALAAVALGSVVAGFL
ncbi:CrcB family protein [Halorientalis sp.]|uniref:fluoride efflux transporter FluC n=1 Tax=Halorientalis sp. TaxID=1931229 RepID=UPI0032C21AF7